MRFEIVSSIILWFTRIKATNFSKHLKLYVYIKLTELKIMFFIYLWSWDFKLKPINVSYYPAIIISQNTCATFLLLSSLSVLVWYIIICAVNQLSVDEGRVYKLLSMTIVFYCLPLIILWCYHITRRINKKQSSV